MANLAFFFAFIVEFGLKLLDLGFDFGNEDFHAVSYAKSRKDAGGNGCPIVLSCSARLVYFVVAVACHYRQRDQHAIASDQQNGC